MSNATRHNFEAQLCARLEDSSLSKTARRSLENEFLEYGYEITETKNGSRLEFNGETVLMY